MREGVAWSVFCVCQQEKPVRPPEELSQPGRYLDIPGGYRLGLSAGRTSPMLAVPASRWRYCASSGEASDPDASTMRRTGLYCRPIIGGYCIWDGWLAEEQKNRRKSRVQVSTLNNLRYRLIGFETRSREGGSRIPANE